MDFTRSRLAPLALALVLLAQAPSRAQDPDAEMAKNRDRIAANRFNVDRGYHDYGLHLPGLTDDIATWTKDMKILDAGAGTAGFFGSLLTVDEWREWYEGYWGRKAPGPVSMPQLVAVGVKRPESGTLDAHLAANRFRYIEGALATPEMTVEKEIGLGTVDRILCVFGATSYVEHLDALLASYGKLLKTGGTMRFYLKDSRNTFEDIHGRPISFVDYLSHIPGLEVLEATPMNGGDRAYLVRRTAGRLDVTPLELVRFQSPNTPPPIRAYREAREIAKPAPGSRPLGVELLSRLGQILDLSKEPRLAQELAAAGVNVHGVVTIDTKLLEEAIHSDWKKLVSEVTFGVGDVVPLFAKGAGGRDHTGRILEALPGDRFRIAGGFGDEPFVEASRDELAVGYVADRVVAYETAAETIRDPARTKATNYGPEHMRPDDRALEITKALVARGLPIPGAEAPPGATDWERTVVAHENMTTFSWNIGHLLDEWRLLDHGVHGADSVDELLRSAKLYLAKNASANEVRPIDPARVVSTALLREPARAAALDRGFGRTLGVEGAIGDALLKERVKEGTSPGDRVRER